MLGIGMNELVIILVFAFLLFGPDKLPGMGRTIGRALRQFREAQEGFSAVVQSEVVDPMADAMNGGTAKKKRAAAREASAEDADIDAADAYIPEHEETFAARRARLQAERKAEDAAARSSVKDSVKDEGQAAEVFSKGSSPQADVSATLTATSSVSADADTDLDADLDADADIAPAQSMRGQTSQSAKPDISAAALYSLTIPTRKEEGDVSE